jgi:hypothetical protein
MLEAHSRDAVHNPRMNLILYLKDDLLSDLEMRNTHWRDENFEKL